MSLDKTQPLDQHAKADDGFLEIWRKIPGDYYSPSLSVSPDGEAFRLDKGGSVVTLPFADLHAAALRSPRPSLDESDRRFLVEILKEEIAHREAQSKREQDGIAGEFHIHRLDHSRRLAAILSEPAPSLVSPPPDREAVARFLASPAKPEQTSPGNLGVTAGEERKIG